MKRLTKQKRDQLILACLVILTVLVGLWFLVIRSQQVGLQTLRDEKAAQEHKEAEMREKIKTSKNIDAELKTMVSGLAEQEKDMASGDLYGSLVNTVRQFKMRYKLDIPSFSPASSVTEVDMLPKFPYKQIKISISGTGYYEEIGKFIADFENEYSASRVLNLELTPAALPGNDSKEKLTFRMDIVSLVASGAALPSNSR
jgi:Tfp pilus assembly protein PilO